MAHRRLALLVGNDMYGPDDALVNPPADIRLVAQSLERVGFETEVLANLTRDEMEIALRDFGWRAEGAESALFFFSGHGSISSTNEGYIAGVGLRDPGGVYVPGGWMAIREVLDHVVDRSRTRKANIVVLEACASNATSHQTPTLSSWLGLRAAPARSLVAISTQPGQLSWSESHAGASFFADSLHRRIIDMRAPVQKVFEQAGRGVAERTGLQSPLILSTLPVDYSFHSLDESERMRAAEPMIRVPAGDYPVGDGSADDNPGVVVRMSAFEIERWPRIDRATWARALEVCARDGLKLPTEAQWEIAVARFGARLPSPAGEWVQDWYGANSYESEFVALDPSGPTDATCDRKPLPDLGWLSRSGCDPCCKVHRGGRLQLSFEHRTITQRASWGPNGPVPPLGLPGYRCVGGP